MSSVVYDDIVKIVVPLVQMLIVAFGWRVVSRGNDKREQRKEIRSILNDIRKVVLEIEARAIEYYQLPPNESAEKGMLLKQQLKHVAMLATSVTRQNHKFELSTAVADFRGTVTGQDFESILREARKPNDPLMGKIAVSAIQLIDDMEIIFAKVYSK